MVSLSTRSILLEQYNRKYQVRLVVIPVTMYVVFEWSTARQTMKLLFEIFMA